MGHKLSLVLTDFPFFPLTKKSSGFACPVSFPAPSEGELDRSRQTGRMLVRAGEKALYGAWRKKGTLKLRGVRGLDTRRKRILRRISGGSVAVREMQVLNIN